MQKYAQDSFGTVSAAIQIQIFSLKDGSMKMTSRAAIAVLFFCCVSVVSAQTITVYNSIPKPLPGNVVSMGYECCAVMEFGDGLGLVATGGGTLGQVTVVMSSWGCQTGSWSAGNCATTSGATFLQPITISVWGVNDSSSTPTPAGLLGQIAQTFNIPFRPSSTPNQCQNDATRWYNSKDKTCYHGLATPIVVNFSPQHIPVPANNKIIVTVAYNTTDFGPNPIGPSACSSPSYNNGAGCPYDSLNVSADTTNGNFQLVGSPLDANGVFVRPASNPYAYTPCASPMAAGLLADDSGCWAGYHPQIQVQANTNAKAGPKVSEQ